MLPLNINKIFVVITIFIGIASGSNQNHVRESVLSKYGHNLSNFKEALDYVNQLRDSEKLTGLHALVETMKENDDLYTNEMVQVAVNVKEFVNGTNYIDTESSGLVKQIKNILPGSLQNLTSCSKLRFYQTYLKGYLYADLKLVYSPESRYAFADGASSHLASVWYLSVQGNYVFIINDLFIECLFPGTETRYGLTWIPGLSGCSNQQFWAFEPVKGTNTVRLRTPKFNQYLYVSDAAIEGKRRLKVANDPLNSYWEIHCAD